MIIRQRVVGAIGLLTLLLAGADWPRFRGPQGAGISADTGLPTTWSATENVVWKTAMPGFGSSTPITLDEKIFLTCYSGYGLDGRKPGNQKNLKLHLLCVDRNSGRILWDSPMLARIPEQEFSGFIARHGYASSTPVTDGRDVYVHWGRSGAAAYDLQGTQLWVKDLGSNTHHYGSAASPILAGNLLIVNASIESGTLFGLDKRTGEVVWKVDGIAESRSTPAVIKLQDGREELILSAKDKTRAINPLTGRLLWTCDSARTHVVPMTVVDGDVVFITGGRTPITMAVRAGGRGDVTQTHCLWKIRKSSTISSPVVSDGLLYWFNKAGIASCLDAKTGRVIYTERTGLGTVYASVVMAEGRLYCVSRQKGVIVYAAGREFKEIARNELGDESVFDGTPVIHNSQLLLRSNKFLYCIGK